MSSKDKEEIIGRRLFFKKAAKTAIPLLAGVTIIPNIISCGKDMSIEDAILQSETGCSYNCANSCSSSCGTVCSNSSSGSGCSLCGNGCNNGCGSACSNNCSSGCGDSCSNGSNNNNDDSVSDATGTISGHEYVDLGLSVKWGRCDIDSHRLDQYDLGPGVIGSYHYVTKYNDTTWIAQKVNSEHITDSICGTGLDVATQEWGNNWRLPSKSEWEELFSNCDRQAIFYHPRHGIKFTSRINGRSIFIPYGGYFENGVRHVDDEHMYRFSGTVEKLNYSVSFAKVWILESGTGYITKDDLLKYCLPIRAVTGGGGSTGCNNSCSNSATNNGCANCSSNCASDCTNQCEGLCGGSGCTSTCGGSCDEKCVSCTYSCQNIASGACSGCTANCSSFCSQTCKSMCYHVSWG